MIQINTNHTRIMATLRHTKYYPKRSGNDNIPKVQKTVIMIKIAMKDGEIINNQNTKDSNDQMHDTICQVMEGQMEMDQGQA